MGRSRSSSITHHDDILQCVIMLGHNALSWHVLIGLGQPREEHTSALASHLSNLSSHCRNHSGYELGQWEMMLQCNAVSHWLSPYPEWSLHCHQVSCSTFAKSTHCTAACLDAGSTLLAALVHSVLTMVLFTSTWYNIYMNMARPPQWPPQCWGEVNQNKDMYWFHKTHALSWSQDFFYLSYLPSLVHTVTTEYGP